MKRFALIISLGLLLTACGQVSNPDIEFDEFYEGSAGINNEETKNDNNNLSSNTEKTMTINQTAVPEKGEEIVVIKTNKGTMKARLFPNATPKTVENFKGLIAKNYYDGIIFHRVIPEFMIQGGDPTGTGMGGESLWGGKFDDEFNSDLKNIKGSLSMANAGPNTNGSQFFIVQSEATPWLDGKHSVFGQIFEGMDIVDAIASVDTDVMDKPIETIKMELVTVEKY